MKRADLIEGEVYAYHEYVGRQGIEKINARPIVYLNTDNDGSLVGAYVVVAADGSYSLVSSAGSSKIYPEARHIIATWADYQAHHADRNAINDWRNKADAMIRADLASVEAGFADLGLPIGRLPRPSTGGSPTDYAKAGAAIPLGVLVEAVSRPEPGTASGLAGLMVRLSSIAEASVWRGRVLRAAAEGTIAPKDLASVPIIPDPVWEARLTK